MTREIGYYWVSHECVKNPSWRVAYWDGKLFHIAGATYPYVSLSPLHVDECRIVRDESKRAVNKREKAKRNLHITSVVLKGDRMVDVAKLHGLTPTCVRQIVHRTLERRNPELFKKLTQYRPGQQTPSIGDLATHAAEFGFALRGEELQ